MQPHLSIASTEMSGTKPRHSSLLARFRSSLLRTAVRDSKHLLLTKREAKLFVNVKTTRTTRQSHLSFEKLFLFNFFKLPLQTHTLVSDLIPV